VKLVLLHIVSLYMYFILLSQSTHGRWLRACLF
jgi:hypothetical protein